MKAQIVLGTSSLLLLLASCGDAEKEAQLTEDIAECQDDLEELEDRQKLVERRAECAANVKSIKEAEMAYDAEYNTFLTVTAHPTGTIGTSPQDWANGNTDFQKLGWSPDGQVRGQYSVATTVASSTVPGGDFTVTGQCDVDGNGIVAAYTATKSINTVFLNNNDTF